MGNMVNISMLLLLGVVLVSSVQASTSNVTKSPDTLIEEAEAILWKDCGAACVKVLKECVDAPELRQNRTQAEPEKFWESALAVFTDKTMGQVDYAKRLQASMTSSSQSTLKHSLKTHRAKGLLKLMNSDTACAMSTTCKLRGMVANKCNYGRAGMNLVYQGINLAIHVLGIVITLLCGCLYIHTMATCVLQSVPPICVFPYNVYGKIWTASIQIWEGTKAITKMCMMHGSMTVS